MAITKDEKISKLKELNHELENYFSNTIIPQLFFDKDLILRKFTPPAMKQFNLSQKDLGRSIHDIDNNLRHTSIIENIESVIDTCKILEKEIQTTDLSWYQMNIIPNIDKKEKKPNGVILTFINITNRIRDLKEQETIIADYETLLDTISHDVRNGLTSMLLSVQLLLDSDLNDKKEIKYFSGIIETGIKKIKQIISELFESSTEKHKYKSQDELLNIENILEDVKLTLIDEIFKSKTTITYEINHSEVVFPRRELRSIMYNLVSNAIKFKSPDREPEIIIQTIKEDKFIIISVKDNGIGIEPEKHKDIFAKHFRVEESVEGSGIGLHLVKTLVTNAGGKVEIESTIGKGTEFKIYLKQDASKLLKKK